METVTPKLIGQELLDFHKANCETLSGPELAAEAGYFNTKGSPSPTAYSNAVMVAAGLGLPTKKAKAKGKRSSGKQLDTPYSVKVQKTGTVVIPQALVSLLEGFSSDEPQSVTLICTGDTITVTLNAEADDIVESDDEPLTAPAFALAK